MWYNISMKYLIIVALVFGIVGGVKGYQLAQELKFYEYKAQIQSDRGNIFIYEVVIDQETTNDGVLISKARCYVAVQNMAYSKESGLAMSCK